MPLTEAVLVPTNFYEQLLAKGPDQPAAPATPGFISRLSTQVQRDAVLRLYELFSQLNGLSIAQGSGELTICGHHVEGSYLPGLLGFAKVEAQEAEPAGEPADPEAATAAAAAAAAAPPTTTPPPPDTAADAPSTPPTTPPPAPEYPAPQSPQPASTSAAAQPPPPRERSPTPQPHRPAPKARAPKPAPGPPPKPGSAAKNRAAWQTKYLLRPRRGGGSKKQGKLSKPGSKPSSKKPSTN
jgi:hypothetical protein